MIRVAIDSNILIHAGLEPDSEKGTTDAIVNRASEMARSHRMQLWDCVVCAASAQAGARVLLTEDMQDGRIVDGLRLMNPFAAANDNRSMIYLLGEIDPHRTRLRFEAADHDAAVRGSRAPR